MHESCEFKCCVRASAKVGLIHHLTDKPKDSECPSPLELAG